VRVSRGQYASNINQI